MSDHELRLPGGAGRTLLTGGSFVCCPLLKTKDFINFCRARGLTIDRNRLLCFERLQLFAPVFRVQAESKPSIRISLPLKDGDNSFNTGVAIDTADMSFDYDVPVDHAANKEAYYSRFQMQPLQTIVLSLTFSLQLELLNSNGLTAALFDHLVSSANRARDSLIAHRKHHALALLCQAISDRYYPLTQSNQRTIIVPTAPIFSLDEWTEVSLPDWDWHSLVRSWNPDEVTNSFSVSSSNLKAAYESLAILQRSCDPLEKWKELIKFVRVEERNKLKGDALFAEHLRSSAQMLNYLHLDLYGEELEPLESVGLGPPVYFPEKSVHKDTRRYLELVANRFDLNPSPKLVLFVEGQSEARAVELLFQHFFGLHPGNFAVEVVTLHSVDNATGGKLDRFRAILRLLDYLHHHQVITFIVLDNENNAGKLKAAASKVRSIHHPRRYSGLADHIKIWKTSFEVDNFSSTEIAKALTCIAGGRARFTQKDVANCKDSANPVKQISKLYRQRLNYSLEKLMLTEALVKIMCSADTRRKPSSRPIGKIINKVARLAVTNPLPTLESSWEKNQRSGHFGKIA